MKIILLLLPVLGSVYGTRKTKYGCEGTVLQLSCDSGKYISPVRANFGRFEAGICNAENNPTWSTRCIQPTSLRQVNSLCAGKSSCSIDVTSSVFGDPCPGTYKYLEVHYTCKHKVETKNVDTNLPPWLLKMTATTAKPSTTSTTTTTTAQPEEAVEVIIEEEEVSDKIIDEPMMSVEAMEKTLFDILGEEYIDMSENIENEDTNDEEYFPREKTLYVNLPLQEEQQPVKQNVQIMPEQNTVLFASLISVLCCTLVIFLSAVLYTKYRKRKSMTADTPRKELMTSNTNQKYDDYRQQAQSGVYDYESSSSTNSTVSSIYTSIPDLSTVGSIYTMLPNGDKAIIIPMPSNQQYLRHILANPKLESWSQMPHYQNHSFQQQQHQAQQLAPANNLVLQANALQQLLQPTAAAFAQQQPQENLYMDIEQPKY